MDGTCRYESSSCFFSAPIDAGSTSSQDVAGEQAGQIQFSGKVVDAGGSPIKGAKVRFYELLHGDRSRPYARDIELAADATTGADGAFSFSAPAKSDTYRYGYIIARKEGLAIGLANWRISENQESEIKLGEAKELAGVVVDENDKPISGARISISMLQIGEGEPPLRLHNAIGIKLLTVNTDAAGKFSFGGIPVGAKAEFLVRKAGRATTNFLRRSGNAGREGNYVAGQKDIKLLLPLESRIEGIVVEKETGKPVAGAKVMVTQESSILPLMGTAPVTSNEGGAFSIDALAAGRHFVRFMSPGGGLVDWVAEPANVTLGTGQTKKDVKIELSKGGIAEVLVRDAESKKPIEAVRISLYDQRRRQSYSGRTGKDGVGRIRLLPGTYQSGSAYKQGFSSFRKQKPTTIEEGVTKRLKWKLTALPAIAGVVRDQDGKAISGATLRVCPMGSGEDVISDAEGRFEVTWNTGFFTDERQAPLLVCRHVASNLGAIVIIPEDKKTLDIELKPAVIVTGKVVDPDGRGITDARIRVMLRQTMWSSTMTRDSINTDIDGNFELRAIPVEHRYELRVSAGGYGTKRIEIHADDAIDNHLKAETSTLPPANLSVSGLLADIQGNPVIGASISILSYGEGQPDRVTTKSNSQGRFTLAGVCEGKINLRVDITHEGKRLSARVITNGGATGIKIVAREGRAILQNLGTESYEQIIRSNEKAIAGVAVDESGSPVAGVPLGVRCHRKLREDGKFSWTFSSFGDLGATTDEQGRFAIPIEEDGAYNLLFSPDNYAAIIAYDVPVGKKDLKITLRAGGTVAGRLVRMDKGKKIPIPNAEVKVEQLERASFTHLGFSRDRTTLTDSQGRFRFERLRTKIRPRGSMSEKQWNHIPRVWGISYGDTSKTIAFYDDTLIENFELLVRPDPTQAGPLLGAALPGFDDIKIDIPANFATGRMVLVCFFDMNQRPSRNCVAQLNKRAQELKANGVAVVIVQAAKVDANALRAWAEKTGIAFPVGTIQIDPEETKSQWAIKGLPWLVLADRNHIVAAEGFGVRELGEKTDQINSGK